jgi:hypothetical protein
MLKRGFQSPDGKFFFRYDRRNGVSNEVWCNTREELLKKIESGEASQKRKMFGSTRTIEGIATKLLHGAKGRNKTKDIKITITKDWIIQKLKQGTCELTGLPFVFPANSRLPNAYGPSLDRIDSANRDYSPENTRIVLYQVNVALNRFGECASLPILKAIVAGIEKKQNVYL